MEAGSMNWQEEYKSKLISMSEAVAWSIRMTLKIGIAALNQ